MLDFEKISFNEMDDSDTPIQFFFLYDFLDNGERKLMHDFVDTWGIDEKKGISSIELCLTMFSKDDWKLEAVVAHEYGKEWYEMGDSSNATSFLEIIHKADTKEARAAYAQYKKVKESGYKE